MPHDTKEKRNAYRRAWKLKNLERCREKQRQYSLKYRDIHFPNRERGKRKGQKPLPPEVREENRKRTRRQISHRLIATNRQFLLAYKLAHPCKCGEDHPACLVFHHLRDKKFNISGGIKKSRRLLDAEIAKCVVMCANCHAKLHDAEKVARLSPSTLKETITQNEK